MSYSCTATGTYILWWTCEGTNSQTNKLTQIKVDIDDTDVVDESYAPSWTSNVYGPIGSFKELSLTSGTTYSIKIKWRVDPTSSGTAKIKNARLLIVRRT